MGNKRAQEFAEMVGSDEISIDNALTYHLRSNHYPPVDRSFIPVAKRAIEKANQGYWTHKLEMPNGKTLQVHEIVEGLHLDVFLDQFDKWYDS